MPGLGRIRHTGTGDRGEPAIRMNHRGRSKAGVNDRGGASRDTGVITGDENSVADPNVEVL